MLRPLQCSMLGSSHEAKSLTETASWNLGIHIVRMPQIFPCNIVEGLACFLTVFYWIRVRSLRAGLAKVYLESSLQPGIADYIAY